MIWKEEVRSLPIHGRCVYCGYMIPLVLRENYRFIWSIELWCDQGEKLYLYMRVYSYMLVVAKRARPSGVRSQ